MIQWEDDNRAYKNDVAVKNGIFDKSYASYHSASRLDKSVQITQRT